jgi:hypothetical protein
MRSICISVLVALLLCVPVRGFSQDLGALSGLLKDLDTGKIASDALGESDMVNGLKATLADGVRQAITSLGQKGGYLNNELVRIALPDSLQTVEKGLRAAGQGDLVDEFVTTMNRAAEKAVPETADIFATAIEEMSVADAKEIVNGPDDAATQYFKDTTYDRLYDKVKPIVAEATDSAGATSAYKNMMDQAGPMASLLGGELSLDDYVTEGALEGLFTKLAKEEAAIRSDPGGTGVGIIESVF